MSIAIQPSEINPPQIIPARSLRNGPESSRNYVSRADNRAFEGLDRAINERQWVRETTTAMRAYVSQVSDSVGRFSADRRSEKFGVERVFREQQRVTPRPGQITEVYEASKRKQQLDIARFEQIKAKEQQAVDRINRVYENSRNQAARAYQNSENMMQEQRQKIRLIAQI